MLQPKLNFGFVIIQRPLVVFLPQPPDTAFFEGSDRQVADLVNPLPGLVCAHHVFVLHDDLEIVDNQYASCL